MDLDVTLGGMPSPVGALKATDMSYARRGVGLCIAAAPLVLLAASTWRTGPPPFLRAGIVLELLAIALATLNVYVSFVRGWLYRKRRGSVTVTFRAVRSSAASSSPSLPLVRSAR